MNCERVTEWLDGYLDGELDALHGRELELHAAECASCRQRLRARRALGQALREKLVYHQAPAELQRRARAIAGGAKPADSRTPSGSARPPEAKIWRRAALGWAACAAVLAITCGLILWQGRTLPQAQTHSALVAQSVLDDHLRSIEGLNAAANGPLAGTHLLDIASSDAHALGPWFSGRLAFAAEVRAPAGYELLGGRLDVVLNRQVAAMVFRQGGHVLNLFTWPAQEKGEAADGLVLEPMPNGYAAAKWTENGMEYWAVADAAGPAPGDFAKAYVAAAEIHP